MKKLFLCCGLFLVAAIAHAQTFNLFKPANGLLKGQTTTYVTTAAASSDVRALWSGTCNSSTFLRGDGACASAGGSVSFPLLAPDGASGAPSYSFTSSGGSGMWFDGTGVAINDPVNINLNSAGDINALATGNIFLSGDGSATLLSTGSVGINSFTGNIGITAQQAGSSMSLAADTIQFEDHASGGASHVDVGGTLTVNSIPVVTNDASTVGSIRAVYKSSNENRNTNMTLTADSTLVPVVTSGTYQFHAYLSLAFGGGTQGIKLNWINNASAVVSYVCTATQNTSNANVAPVANDDSALEMDIVSSAAHATMKVVCDGTFTGTQLLLQWAQNSSSGTNTTVLAGSYLQLTRLN